MQTRSRSLTWRGQTFGFHYLPAVEQGRTTPEWAVSRAGEFIGTMECSPDVTTRDFDMRGLRWLAELLGTRASDRQQTA